MAEVFKVEGLKELNRALKELPARSAKSSLRSSVTAGGSEIVKSMRRELKSHNDTGNLSKSLGTKVLKPLKYTITAIIGPRVGYTGSGERRKRVKNDGWYAHLIEYGVAPHKIKARKDKTLYFNGQFFNAVDHPGFEAKPFMRPGLDKSKQKVVDRVGKQLWKAIQREAAKLK